MSRPLRIQYPGAWYHVMNRGAGKRAIFVDDGCRKSFLKLLEETVKLWKIRIHAYSLRTTHYHLNVETPEGNLSRAMRHIDGVYTQRFNKFHDTDGPLFRGRYKSILLDKDSYLLESIRYIHNQAVKSGDVDDPTDDRWTSHRAYMINREKPEWLTTDKVLGMFSSSRGKALKSLHEFVMMGVPEDLERRLSGKKWPSILGSKKFKKRVIEEFLDQGEIDKEISEIKTERRIYSIDDIVDAVCQVFNCPDKNQLREKYSRRVLERNIAIYLCRCEMAGTQRDIGEYFGNMSYSGVSKAYAEIERAVKGKRYLEIVSKTRQLLKDRV